MVDLKTYILELFHGPTCAFKDFGARFMARVMSYFNKDEDQPLHILVATSGDTGSAVGSAFHKSVDFVTEVRTENSWLIFLLP